GFSARAIDDATGLVFRDGAFDHARTHTQPSPRQWRGENTFADGSDEIDGRVIDVMTSKDDLFFSGFERGGETATVGIDTAHIGRVTDRGADELVGDQQRV